MSNCPVLPRCLVAALSVAAVRRAEGRPPTARPPRPAPRRSARSAADWRTPDPDDVLVIDTNKGRILVEMVPEVAPQHVTRMRELAHENFFDGRTFFRVIDDFMDQTGDPQNSGQGGSVEPNVPAEFTFRRDAATPLVLAAGQSGGRGRLHQVAFRPPSQTMISPAITADQKVNAWGSSPGRGRAWPGPIRPIPATASSS